MTNEDVYDDDIQGLCYINYESFQKQPRCKVMWCCSLINRLQALVLC